MDLFESALVPQELEERRAERILTAIAGIFRSEAAFLYIGDSRLTSQRFFHHGFHHEVTPAIEKLCPEHFERIAHLNTTAPEVLTVSSAAGPTEQLTVFPVRAEEKCIGLVGLKDERQPFFQHLINNLLRLLANAVEVHLQRAKTEREFLNLNNYVTVSSMLAQSIDLHELLETTLYCCMDAVSAEASSILLLDDEKKNFFFYQIEGPAKPILMARTFPADKGIAASVLETERSAVINDVYNDPRFYGRIDSESGFRTRNMLAIPLIAGEEKIGVLEVLNKSGGADFTRDEVLFLELIAEEIAFAIRNAKVFDYVVNSYCKQRQGLNTCRGCQRPLGSWTPCVKYRTMTDEQG